MKMSHLTFAAISLATAASLHADPYCGFCYPAGIQAGTSNRFVIGGQRLGNVKCGWVSGKGVRVVKVESVKNFPVPNGKNQGTFLHKWMRSIMDGKRERPPYGAADRDLAGWTRHPFYENMGSLPPLEFSMTAHYLVTPRNALQASPALSERMIVTIVADPDAEPGVRDLVLCEFRGTSAPRPFIVSAEPHVAEPLFSPSRNQKKGTQAPQKQLEKTIGLPVVLDGQIMPGETDTFTLSLKKGPVQFALTGRELTPYLGDAVPGFFNPVLRLTTADGREVAFADDFSYLPDPVLAYEVPSSGTYRLEVRDNLYRGRADFVYSIACRAGDRNLPSIKSRAFACYPPPAYHVPAETTGSVVRCGTIATPGSIGSHTFTIREPSDWTIELFARRQGSPLDGVVRLYGPCSPGKDSAPLLATWDDTTNLTLVGSVPQACCDPIANWHFDRAGNYRVTVADRVGSGGNEYRYALRLKRMEPDFEAYLLKSSVQVARKPGSATTVKARVVRRNGFKGAVKFEDTGAIHFHKNTIPADKDEAVLTCSLVRSYDDGPFCLDVFAKAEIKPGKSIRRPVVAVDETEQAFAWTHLLPSRGLYLARFRGRDQSPLDIGWLPMPHDSFLPPRVLRPDEATIRRIPDDFGPDILRARLEVPSRQVRDQLKEEIYAYSPEGGDSPAKLARAVLSGVTRFIKRDYTFDDGDERRVRYLALASTLRPDNDLMLFAPAGDSNSVNKAVFNAARKLRNLGYAFDFVNEARLGRNNFVKRHRAIYIPKGIGPLPESVRTRLEECRKQFKLVVYPDGLDGVQPKRKMSELLRCEEMPKGVRFARFCGDQGFGITWYFVHNASNVPAQGPWDFASRDRARFATALNPDDGSISPLTHDGYDSFAFTLEPHSSMWICVSPRKN